MRTRDETVQGETVESGALKLRPGDTIAERYVLEAQLGAGGMGVVFRAIDRRLERVVAVKVLHRGGAMAIARLQREARVAARVQAPGLCQIFDVGEHADRLFMVMDLLEGETLRSRQAGKSPDVGRTVAWMTSAAKTMALVHAHDIVHRDLKPENLFLDRRGSTEQLVVLDFGLAFASNDADPRLGRLTNPDEMAGTPTYMSPEQAGGREIGPAADVYALGCVFYELLAGEPPFVGEIANVLGFHLLIAPPGLCARAPWVPRELEILVNAMLAKTPADRPTMRTVADALTAELPGESLQPIEARMNRMLTAGVRGPRAAATLGDASGAVWVVGEADPELLLTLAASDLDVVTTEAAADVVLVLAPEAVEIAALVARGRRVIASAPVGDLGRAHALIQLGVADVVTTPLRNELVAKKLTRILRTIKRSKP